MRATLALLLVILLTGAGTLSPALAQTNLVQNGDFEQDSDQDGFPDYWQGHNLGPYDRLELDPSSHHQVFAIVGEQGLNKALRQVIRARLDAGTSLIVEASSKQEGASKAGGLYAFKVEFVFTDGSRDVVLKSFSPGTEGWMRRIADYSLPKDSKRIVVSVVFTDQSGKASFDNVSVFVEAPG